MMEVLTNRPMSIEELNSTIGLFSHQTTRLWSVGHLSSIGLMPPGICLLATSEEAAGVTIASSSLVVQGFFDPEIIHIS